MKIKLANASDAGIDISNISRSFYIDNKEEKDSSPVENISIGVEPPIDMDFEEYKNYFQNGDVSEMKVYDSKDRLLATFNATSVEAITQNVNEDGMSIFISVNC